MHVRLAYVLSHNRDAELPHVHLFVVCSGDESSAILNKSDRIDRAQVFLVLLHNLLRVGVELQDFLVGAACEEDVLFVFGGVEFDAKRGSPVGETADHLTSLGVPKVDQFVKPCAQESFTIVREADVAHCLLVTFVRPDALAVRHSVPNLARSIVTGRQQQMACPREELDPLDSSVVTRPSVQPLLWNEAVMLFVPQVTRRLNETLTSLVEDSTITMVD